MRVAEVEACEAGFLQGLEFRVPPLDGLVILREEAQFGAGPAVHDPVRVLMLQAEVASGWDKDISSKGARPAAWISGKNSGEATRTRLNPSAAASVICSEVVARRIEGAPYSPVVVRWAEGRRSRGSEMPMFCGGRGRLDDVRHRRTDLG